MNRLDYLNISSIINKTFLNFTYALLKNIFLKDKTSEKEKEKLNVLLKKINENIIQVKEKQISFDYTIKNFDNIVNFIKSQNSIYVGEILEYLLLKIFIKVIKVKPENTINTYIHNNLSKIRNDNSFLSWFLLEKLTPNELHYLDEFIIYEKDDLYYYNSPFCYLLYRINYEKYNLIRICAEKNNKTIKYIFNDDIPPQELLNYSYKLLRDRQKSLWDEDISRNSIMNLISIFSNPKVSNDKIVYINLIKYFLYSVFVYYQTINSPLINYTKEEIDSNGNYLSSIPYSYDFGGAIIEGRFANIIMSTIRAEKRISNILLKENNIREPGMLELGKSLVFNKNIKRIELDKALIKSYYLDYFILGMGIYDNYSVKELNLSNNYLTGNAEKNLIKIMLKLKELKTLNLSNNEIKNGFSSFFVDLKKLYQKNETKIENLILNLCHLDDSCFVELGELLKCKFCKLKKLFLIDTKFSNISNFLKKLKKNKILTHIYLGKNSLGNKDVNDINKIISNSGLKHIYFFRNKISNFKEALRIIYRTRIIKKNEGEKNINLIDKSNSVLQSLDLSNNYIINKNEKYIQLFSKIINETSLDMLDFSKIIYDNSPKLKKKSLENKIYGKEVQNLVKNLSDKKDEYIDLMTELRSANTDINRFNKDEFDYSIFKNLDSTISNIIKDKKARFPLYLKEEAKKLIKEENFEMEETDDEEQEDEMTTKLVDYMAFQREKNNWSEIMKKRDLYNMVLI